MVRTLVSWHSLCLPGFRVFATARSAEGISELAELGIETLSLDVTSTDQIAKVAEEVSSRTGGTLDILVNNAGLPSAIPALDAPEKEIRDVFAANVFSVIFMVQAFSKMLIRSKGLIMQIGSLTQVVPLTYGGTSDGSL